MFKFVYNTVECCKVLFLFLMGTILLSCKSNNKQFELIQFPVSQVDKIITVRDTIFIINEVKSNDCDSLKYSELNDSLMMEYIKMRNKKVIDKIQSNKGIIFNDTEISKYLNY